MLQFPVPGPEPGWEPAAQYQGGKRNPALQYSAWEAASANLILGGVLAAPLDALAARLRLHVEHTWADPGPVAVALFRIAGAEIALSAIALDSEHAELDANTMVWISKSTVGVEETIATLLTALGLPQDAFTTVDRQT
ncbi:hypothetical protein ACQPW1_19575 [Nocardia sp. CA-128927]|uniref:hypothetical protein n=1 Tax=Nocardia sp. CA-128927 TaxID=3239975 RepID=UPI003D98BD58